MSQATRRAPAGRLTARKFMDDLVTSLTVGGAHTNTNTNRALFTKLTRPDPDTIEMVQADGTKYQLTLGRV